MNDRTIKSRSSKFLRKLVGIGTLFLWGAAPVGAASVGEKPLFRDYMGLNGHSFKFKPDLYAPVARLLRDYHPYVWDVAGDTTEPLQFPYSRERVNQGQPVDWKAIYASWKEAGFEINTSLQFNWFKKNPNHPNAKFDDFPNDVEMYARQFAEYFGPSGEHKLVTSVEVGNEVTHWEDDAYLELFRAVARGLRAGDSELTILPATVSSMEKRIPQEKPIQLLKNDLDLFDVINVHTYSVKEHYPTWERSYPEDPNIEYLKVITEMVEWRDQYAPDKPIWVTEFGYDAASEAALQQPRRHGMKKWVSSTELQQAQWLVRSFLVFSELDVDRAYMYYFNDKDEPSFHAASGLTRNFEPKPAYYAMRQLFTNLGDFRFSKVVVKSPGDMYAYEYIRGEGTDHGAQRVWVVWKPTSGEALSIHEITSVPIEPLRVESFALDSSHAPETDRWRWQDGTLKIEVGESPVYVFFDR